jgi:hypothetical protein
VNEDSQIVVPDAFLALFKPAGAVRAVESSDVIAARHELCDDMAQMLTETARSTMFELGIAEEEVLERVQQGLLAEGSVVSAAEARWITGRLAELLEWSLPPALS